MNGDFHFTWGWLIDWILLEGNRLPEKYDHWSAVIALFLTVYSLAVPAFYALNYRHPKFWFNKLCYLMWDIRIPLGKDAHGEENAGFPLAIVWFLLPFIPFGFWMIPVRWLFYFYFKMTG